MDLVPVGLVLAVLVLTVVIELEVTLVELVVELDDKEGVVEGGGCESGYEIVDSTTHSVVEELRSAPGPELETVETLDHLHKIDLEVPSIEVT